ncbi:MAG: VOC family protein [Alphaproteobacteria bacterium]|nr:VOC family protein [Alphaproteobacteria bacterium]
MRQLISLVTLGVDDLARSRRFYVDGFGWKPVFEAPHIVFYQMNGLVFSTWLRTALDEETKRSSPVKSAGFTLAHSVESRGQVQPILDHLAKFGGRILRPASEPPHGGMRGLVADPDEHAWEIAWNPAWPIDAQGRVRFGT